MKMMNAKDKITGPNNLGNPNEIVILQLAKKNNSIDSFKIKNKIYAITHR